ncbi:MULTISPECIES: hypothetical protein [unclassified Cryobacterium]|uniref:hypothetical protein n=1 Tax=unclassified Cryobacterium TaxID=2649013 RepID=UPI002AB3FF6C|nr:MULTISPECIES: hypothetical protein [unclassified Cryobacterium]MDY7528447.1 hypothetical protein [Cryobacterium sp. 10C2]MDY7555808.1 hypothetical protein [Cryobacterium sp. 10C3]MEB0289167.1 hypothetical protein [Cryobacterium sp. 10C2]
MPAWLQGVTLGDALLWLGGIIAAALAVWRGWPTFRKVVAFLARGIKLVDTLANLPEDLGFIKHELEANSGKSVKDITTRTEAAVNGISTEVAHVKRQGAALKTSVAKSNRRLTLLEQRLLALEQAETN